MLHLQRPCQGVEVVRGTVASVRQEPKPLSDQGPGHHRSPVKCRGGVTMLAQSFQVTQIVEECHMYNYSQVILKENSYTTWQNNLIALTSQLVLRF